MKIRMIVLALSLCFSSNLWAADICKQPADAIISQSMKVMKQLKKEGCSYTRKKNSLVTKTSHNLRQRYLCAVNKGESSQADALAKSARNLLNTYSEICAS